MRRGEIWWADLGSHRPLEQTGRRPVIVWQSDELTGVLESVLVVPLTTNLSRAQLAGTAMIEASAEGLPEDSVALAFQMRAVPKRMLSALRGVSSTCTEAPPAPRSHRTWTSRSSPSTGGTSRSASS